MLTDLLKKKSKKDKRRDKRKNNKKSTSFIGRSNHNKMRGKEFRYIIVAGTEFGYNGLYYMKFERRKRIITKNKLIKLLKDLEFRGFYFNKRRRI